MPGLGLSCNVGSGRVTVRGVTVDDDVATEVFLHRTVASEDVPLQLRSLADAFATRLADLSTTAVVVRSADHHPSARITDGSALRLRAEGVLLATARARLEQVRCLSGREVGDLCGESKADIEARAASMISPAAAEATAAALAADQLAESD